MDGQGVKQEVEVLHPVYLEFLRFVKKERNLKRWTERYQEHTKLTEEELYKRLLYSPKSIEDILFENIRNDLFIKILENLTEKQRQRFVLYFEFEMTYEQIAEMEGCTKRAIKFSIDQVMEKIKNL
jgi:RNA polymerase sigma-70 factor (ECF subfamily)